MTSSGRSITTHNITSHPADNAILVEYSVDNDSTVRSKKVILGDLSSLNDTLALAKKVILKCNCITEDWIDDVEDAIIELCNRSDLNSSDQQHNADDSDDSVSSEYVQEVCVASLEFLYGTSDEQLSAVNKLLDLCQDVGAMEYLIQNHQLMSALTRLFVELANSSELSFAIGKLFLAFSIVEDFHATLSSYRVGALALEVVELEVRRAWHRSVGATNDVASSLCLDTDVDFSSVDLTSRAYTFSNKQEHVILVCLSILSHLADDFDVLRKMTKKSLVCVLSPCLQQKSMQSVLTTLVLLKKASIFEETAIGLSSGDGKVIPKLVHLLQLPSVTINEVAITILYNLSFHDDCVSLMSAENIYSPLVAMMQSSTCCSVFELAYHLSSTEDNRHMFVKEGISPALVDVLANVTSNKAIGTGLVGLLVNVSSGIVACTLCRLPPLIHTALTLISDDTASRVC